jgi:hypothetical protein
MKYNKHNITRIEVQELGGEAFECGSFTELEQKTGIHRSSIYPKLKRGEREFAYRRHEGTRYLIKLHQQ